jgi:Deoxynucleotide monophosphate kinase
MPDAEMSDDEAERMIETLRRHEQEHQDADRAARQPELDAEARAIAQRAAREQFTSNPTPPMIGLAGYSHVGKDTLAGLLVDRCGFHRIGLADPLYAMLLALDPLIPAVEADFARPISVSKLYEHCDRSWTAAKTNLFYGPGLRAYLQRLGTEAVRKHLGEDAWVRAAQRKIDQEGWTRVVVSDVRFPNEAKWIHYCGGVVVRIERPGYGPVNEHVSDTGQDAVRTDVIITNDGPPEAMLDNLIACLPFVQS